MAQKTLSYTFGSGSIFFMHGDTLINYRTSENGKYIKWYIYGLLDLSCRWLSGI